MKILCVIDSLGPGGAQRQLVGLGSGFKEKGHEVVFLTYYDIKFYNHILEQAGIPIICICEPNYLRRLIKIRRYIRHGNFDAVLSFLEGANFCCEFAGLPFRKWKLIVGERNADPQIRKSVRLILYRWFHLFADYVVANSKSNIQIVRSVNPLIKNRKCRVIYNIIDFDRWKPGTENELKADSKIELVIAASHIYRKNLIGLVEALSLLTPLELDKIRVSWYGDHIAEPFYDNSLPEARKRLQTLNLENIITFFPATSDIPEKIRNSDAVGLFSFVEGLPNVVCEGMACAKPVVCSNISDVSDYLYFDTNLLFNPEDSQSIKLALQYLIASDNEKLRQIGLANEEISKRLFVKEKILSEYTKLFCS
jgi:glycosyltransferase involved in cell wall biosynthesis